MKYLRLIAKNAVRNRRRTALTLLSVGVSLFLLVSLRTFIEELEGSSILVPSSALRLITRNKVSLMVSLPLAHLGRIQQIEGIELVTPFQWFGGYYQDPMHLFAQFGGDPEVVARIAPEYHTPPEQMEAWKRDRTGAHVPKKLAEKFGWQLGDRITIVSRAFPFNLELTVRSIYVGPEQTAVWFHYEYFHELMRQWRPERADRVTSFYIKVRRPEDAARVAAAIDDLFRNSEAPTYTETEKSFMLSFTSMLGNVKVFLAAIAAAVVFAIFLVTLNTMAMTVRERTAEIAVLKTLGFTRARVLGLLVAESSLTALAGGLLGVGAALAVFGSVDMYKLTNNLLQHFNVQPLTIAAGLLLAALVGVASALLPSWRAASGSIAAALRQVG